MITHICVVPGYLARGGQGTHCTGTAPTSHACEVRLPKKDREIKVYSGESHDQQQKATSPESML